MSLAKVLVVTGVVLVVAGLLVGVGGRLGLGRLPGDLRFGSDNVRVYVPVTTMIIVSVVLTIVVNLFFRR
ncbi:MAG: DUF2905 domain-containing protein [Actinomycetota bacterium]|nr:DUF2905 domain-containing protein [Actinomycetota bacterium]